tara:strand:+ start:2659 stop:3831 length:1173 start_codon:yes stop_codon:yes gene_type:complete
MSRFPQYNVNNDHQLIRRQNTYVLARKLVTIHSNDRDINKWPNSNHFEVTMPEDVTNVQSMRLVEIQLPNNQYIFSSNQQNIKLGFCLDPNVSNNMAVYQTLASNVNQLYYITIQEGYYTPTQMANEIQNLMNKSVTDYLHSVQPLLSGYKYTNFKVYYDTVGQQLYFGNVYDSFSFSFDTPIVYDVSCSSIINSKQPTNVFSRYTNWGLGSYLGFEKQQYTAIPTDEIVFNYNNLVWLLPDTTQAPTPPPTQLKAYYIKAPMTISVFGDSVIYMEVDKYNSMDELKPFSEATNNTYNNDYNGSNNAAFAKIPITSTPESQIFDTKNKFLHNTSQYDPPIDKIRKLKFTFRYHDGRLAEFKDCPFNFTIAFNQLRDEIARDYEIRVPANL